MEPLKPRDKVTQHMTRDGLTLDNQTTGESVNVSSREAEQEYTAQPEGAAEKILERADELHDRHKAKKAAKDAGETVVRATGPVSRLQFTAEERASPELAPYIKKAEKRADKLEAAKEALPKKRVVTKETVYDEAKGKAKSRLYFDKVEKAPPQLKPNPASRPIQEAGLYLHGKIHEVEHENVGVEKIREYVYFTDTKASLPESHPDEPYFMGVHIGSAYYFYYEKQTVTTLNREFLHTVKTEADAYVIYADLCTLSEAELEKYHITFKKIPRAITKL